MQQEGHFGVDAWLMTIPVHTVVFLPTTISIHNCHTLPGLAARANFYSSPLSLGATTTINAAAYSDWKKARQVLVTGGATSKACILQYHNCGCFVGVILPIFSSHGAQIACTCAQHLRLLLLLLLLLLAILASCCLSLSFCQQ